VPITTYIGLLPAVNVGGHRKVSMTSLSNCVRRAGGDHVKTYVQSGNVVFTTRTARKKVADGITEELRSETGHEIPVVLRTLSELDAVVTGNPFADRADDGKALHVVFLDQGASGAIARFDPSPFAPEEVAVGKQELYLFLPNGMGRAKLPQALTRATTKRSVVATARNWRTTTTLLDLARQADAAARAG
jgi:uncharacterized protein (DUF1697 family)